MANVNPVQMYSPEMAGQQQQLEQAQRLAAMLEQQSMDPVQSYSQNAPISWTQGAAKLAQALMAKREQKKVGDTRERIATLQGTEFDRMFPQQAPPPAPMQPGADISPDQALAASMAPTNAPPAAQQLGAALGPQKPAQGGPPSLTGNPQQDRMIAMQIGMPAYMEQIARRSSDPEGFGQAQAVQGADGKMHLVQFGNRGTSRAVEGYAPDPNAHIGNFNPGDYTPDSLAKWQKSGNSADLVRVWAPTVATVAGGQTLIDRSAGGANAPARPATTAISTVQQEADAKAQIAGAEAGAKATAQADAERAAGIQNKGSGAVTSLGMLDIAEPLIDMATGSTVGAAVDKVAGFFGHAMDGAQAISQLKVLQNNLMLNMPRMEGPQSDRDVDLYREAAGQIGDPNVPGEIKKAAIRTIRDLQTRYKERAAAAPGAAPGVASPGKPAAAPAPAAEAVAVDKNGNRFVVRGGKWVPQ